DHQASQERRTDPDCGFWHLAGQATRGPHGTQPGDRRSHQDQSEQENRLPAGQALEDGGLTAGSDTRETCPVGYCRRGHPLVWSGCADLAHRDDTTGRPRCLPPAERDDKTLGLNAHCPTSLLGAFANSAPNCENSTLKGSRIRGRSAASEPNVISATVLASAVTISSTSMVSFSPLNEPYSA